MQRLAVIFLAFLCATASAEVYRRIGPDGHVYFVALPGHTEFAVFAAAFFIIQVPLLLTAVILRRMKSGNLTLS